MFITGPKVIETVTGEKISSEELGGSKVHNSISGNAHFRGEDEKTVLENVRKLLAYLPQNNEEKPPVADYDETDDYRADLADVVPYETIRPYDVRRVIEQVVDADSFMEVQPEFARNIVVGCPH